MISKIEKLCAEKNIKLTENRKIIAKVISDSKDHPDVEEVFYRACRLKSNIGIATVYRTIRMFEEEGVIAKHDFGKGRARYEEVNDNERHDHLIDINSGKVIEFCNQEVEEMIKKIAADLGYKLIDYRLELHALPIKKPEPR